MDEKYLQEFYSNATPYNKARVKGLQMNGASNWRDAPFNYYYGVKFDNQQMFMLTLLMLGAFITNNEHLTCNCCGDSMDNYGYHALTCPNKGLMQRRHNAIVQVLNKFLNKAGFKTECEQTTVKQREINKVHQRPGDIKIYNFYNEKSGDKKHLYIDITVEIIFAETYVHWTAEARGF